MSIYKNIFWYGISCISLKGSPNSSSRILISVISMEYVHNVRGMETDYAGQGHSTIV